MLVLLGAAELAKPDRRDLETDLARWIPRERIVACELWPEPAAPLPEHARVACFVTARPEVERRLRAGLARHGVDVRIFSSNLARRGELDRDVEAALREDCDVFLTELKAAAIDVVAEAAARAGAQVVFLRNRPVAEPDQPPLDDALAGLVELGRTRAARAVAEAPS